MSSILIHDLAHSAPLDRQAMSAVRGGWKMAMPAHMPGDLHHAPSFDSSIGATQNLAQMQQVVTATANGSAFVTGVQVDSHVAQDGNNRIVRR